MFSSWSSFFLNSSSFSPASLPSDHLPPPLLPRLTVFPCQLSNQKLEEAGRAGMEGGLALPKAGDNPRQEESSEEEEEEEDSVGPMPPPAAPKAKHKEKKDAAKDPADDSEESDEESSGEEDERDNPVNRIPWSHEIKLNHGEKPITR